ncbi:MAG: cysteine desulfurase family protein [Methylophilaceae bacterium]
MTTAATYFDNNGTTLLDPRVLEAMLPYLSQQYGNATSRHIFGRSARHAIEHAREQIADAIGAHTSQVVLTGSGTESNNLAISGIASMNEGRAIAISAIEHPCVTRPALALQKNGCKLNMIEVDADGMLDQDSLLSSLEVPTSLVSVMLANNETGVIQDIAKVAEIARSHQVFVHTDAVQALGKIKVDFSALNVHAMTLSSHKIYGPQGAGALILDKRVDIQPLLLGGGQEKGLRSGTENVAAIVGFGTACELISRELLQHTVVIRQMRDYLEQGLQQLGAVIFGSRVERLPNTSFFAIPGIEGETLVMALDRKGFAVASGSACSSDSTEPSHVLLAMGIDKDLARGALRVSLSSNNTLDEIKAFLLVLESELSRLKKLTAMAM